jgi:uncharacterized membrane protein YccC
MALDAPTLGAAMRTALLAAPATGVQDNAATTALCNAIASAVVAHITSAGVVTVTVTTTGTAAAQSGGGTGTIT